MDKAHPHAGIVVHELSGLFRRLQVISRAAGAPVADLRSMPFGVKYSEFLSEYPHPMQNEIIANERGKPIVRSCYEYSQLSQSQLEAFYPLPSVAEKAKAFLLQSHKWQHWLKWRNLSLNWKHLAVELERTLEAVADICWFSYNEAAMVTPLPGETVPPDFALIKLILRDEVVSSPHHPAVTHSPAISRIQSSVPRFLATIQFNSLDFISRSPSL